MIEAKNRPRSEKAIPWTLAVVPALSFGFLAALPFIHLADRRRSLKFAVTATVYSTACVGEWSMMILDAPENTVPDNIGATLCLALIVIGTAHAFVWRGTLADALPEQLGNEPAALTHILSNTDSTTDTCARLQHTMARLKSHLSTRADIPPNCRRLCAEAFVPIGRVLGHGATGGCVDSQLQAVENILVDYLPTSLHTYERLPQQFARTHRNSDGRTAGEELEFQLCLIRDRATEVAASLFIEDARRLQEQSVFLHSKFGHSELNLSDVDAVRGPDIPFIPYARADSPRPHRKSR